MCLLTQLCLRCVVKNKSRLTTSSSILYVTAGASLPEVVIVTIWEYWGIRILPPKSGATVFLGVEAIYNTKKYQGFSLEIMPKSNLNFTCTVDNLLFLKNELAAIFTFYAVFGMLAT